ncbi:MULTISPECIES: nicotinate (nicotinamide) nucleotide adenylyltransferase [Parabacteroides]|uniref:Probable nicotinate-nucleotide adenylyltransferase n=1 Tax=Parabacteroides faecis TaxID=1217282 RepID=A0ABR6KU69_9BACT|nr:MULTISPECIES: nicotinate (nicotinamide) nucleotide adenylyltransferase [Parabacteroides]MBB4625041.1 nicotinate-nucleotide adenylyltransferase [Parabacteroides faecis]MBC8619154.1 nicotinate-nucleotide adenylyltransferase [Parabacteroides faecis]RHR37834.1 nicotinate-nucleotide adenylyltransferase [Parabacteroides sp. AF18-52]RHR99923.1 nicotinate-nucleotide adenylyltransferase [Parabacteroides sp. AF14-59]GGK16207.1 putative nicotinate-nucleotide adenylyltransferase [Parabacteroides faecis
MEKTAIKEIKKLNTGIFSGSFNPVHIGHLALANWLCEFAGLDEVWFVITPHNPLKDRSNLMDDRLRYELVEASIAGYPKFKASDFEFSLPQPTYTIDTLRALEKTYPDRQFHFIMGADNWAFIKRWKESDQLISNYPILVYPRKGYEIQIPSDIPSIRKVDAPLMEISSTFIRESLKAGKDVRFFLPEAIRNHKCFSNI